MGKIPHILTIPDELRAFLKDVNAQIEAGGEETKIESDDLIQSRNAYGGLVDATAGLFCFRYFPVAEADLTWDMCFNRDELRDIATGQMKQVTLWKCDNGACACLYECEDAYCSNCDTQDELA